MERWQRHEQQAGQRALRVTRHRGQPAHAARDGPAGVGVGLPLEHADDGLGTDAVLHRQVLDAIRKHRSTIVFVNARGHAERLAQQINELADEELAASLGLMDEPYPYEGLAPLPAVITASERKRLSPEPLRLIR